MAITISGSGITSANIADGTITTDDILASDVKNLKSGRKNLIINGDMQVSQRGTTAGTPNTNNYLLDRFTHSRFGGYPDNATQSQVTDAPSGFTTSFKMIRNSAHTLTGTNATAFSQIMEGLNVSHLNWGTATARPITISFWVKSNQTGSFPLTLADSANAYDIGKLYVIGSADTWEYKTVNIEAPTTGTFDTGNTTSFTASWGFGSTSSARTAQGTTWGTSNSSGSSKAMVTGASTALATTNGATWQITGVQLELGSVATDFEHRSYGEELALCQRYYQKSYREGDYAGEDYSSGHSFSALSTYPGTISGWEATTPYHSFNVPMARTPDVTVYSPKGGAAGKFGGSYDAATSSSDQTAYSVQSVNRGFFCYNGSSSLSSNANGNNAFHFVADAEL
jgi:hypothetical protein